MKLLDVARVAEQPGHLPVGAQTRLCAVQGTMEVFCAGGPADGVVLYAGDGEVGTLRSNIISIEARLPVPVVCDTEDSEQFVKAAMVPITERALGAYLVTEKPSGAENQFWIGSADIKTADTITAARTLLYDSGPLLEGEGILHIDPATLPQLMADGLVKSEEKGTEHYTPWGDPVVLNASYTGVAPFWTGPLTVALSPVDAMATNAARANSVLYDAFRSAVILLDECTVVRAG